MFRPILVLVLSMVLAAPVAAQGNVMTPGDRIRVALGADTALAQAGMPAPPRATLTGTLISLSTDSLRLRSGATIRSLPVPEVLRIERFAGRRSYKLRGFLIGAAIGVLGGAVAGAASGDLCTANPYGSCSTAESALSGAIVFGAISGFAGFLFGLPSHDQWDAVPRPWQPVRAERPS